jgi:hypothetical protein
MFWIESEQFRSQFRNMVGASRVKEARRIFEKFFNPSESQSLEALTAVNPDSPQSPDFRLPYIREGFLLLAFGGLCTEHAV